MAVLPFEATGGGEAQVLASGLSQQLVTDLMRFPGLRLYAGADPADSARLGVTYAVSGTVTADASGVRIGARLVDIGTRRVLWSETYDRALSPQALLEGQAALAADIASALGQPYGVVQADLSRRVADGAGATMPSYACVLRSNAYRRTFSQDLYAPILGCLERAVARDPGYAEAWAMLGWLRMDGIRFGYAGGGGTPDFGPALDAATHALSLDSSNVTALKALSSINYYAGQHAEAERLQRRALALNPNDPDTLAQLGWRVAARGGWDEGIPYLERAIARSVDPPGWYYHLIAVDAYRRGDHRAMLAAARDAAVDGSGISWSLLAIAQGAAGDEDGARASLEKMAQRSPALAADPARVYRGHQLVEDMVEELVEGLRVAGWEPATKAP